MSNMILTNSTSPGGGELVNLELYEKMTFDKISVNEIFYLDESGKAFLYETTSEIIGLAIFDNELNRWVYTPVNTSMQDYLQLTIGYSTKNKVVVLIGISNEDNGIYICNYKPSTKEWSELKKTNIDLTDIEIDSINLKLIVKGSYVIISGIKNYAYTNKSVFTSPSSWGKISLAENSNSAFYSLVYYAIGGNINLYPTGIGIFETAGKLYIFNCTGNYLTLEARWKIKSTDGFVEVSKPIGYASRANCKYEVIKTTNGCWYSIDGGTNWSKCINGGGTNTEGIRSGNVILAKDRFVLVDGYSIYISNEITNEPNEINFGLVYNLTDKITGIGYDEDRESVIVIARRSVYTIYEPYGEHLTVNSGIRKLYLDSRNNKEEHTQIVNQINNKVQINQMIINEASITDKTFGGPDDTEVNTLLNSFETVEGLNIISFSGTFTPESIDETAELSILLVNNGSYAIDKKYSLKTDNINFDGFYIFNSNSTTINNFYLRASSPTIRGTVSNLKKKILTIT